MIKIDKTLCQEKDAKKKMPRKTPPLQQFMPELGGHRHLRCPFLLPHGAVRIGFVAFVDLKATGQFRTTRSGALQMRPSEIRIIRSHHRKTMKKIEKAHIHTYSMINL